MRQRINVVRALLNTPKVLYLDEPTLGLDPQSSVEIRAFVKKLNRENGTTVIVTTHMMVDADLMCDRIAIVDHGKIEALDTSVNLKKQLSGANATVIKLEISNLNPEIIATIQELHCSDSVTQEDAVHLKILVHGEEAFDSIIDAIRAKGGKITSMENLQPTLEDVFLHITGHQVRDSADQKMPMAKHRGPFARQQSRIR
jgi:ABC-2 type transport system ATP-binding protein